MPKMSRNSLCHCGSKHKYKKCCMEKDEAMSGAKAKTDLISAQKVLAAAEKVPLSGLKNSFRDEQPEWLFDREARILYLSLVARESIGEWTKAFHETVQDRLEILLAELGKLPPSYTLAAARNFVVKQIEFEGKQIEACETDPGQRISLELLRERFSTEPFVCTDSPDESTARKDPPIGGGDPVDLTPKIVE